MPDAPIVDDSVVELEIELLDREENPWRARLARTVTWWSADTKREALRGAIGIATDDELEAALGELWRAGHA